MHKQIPSNPDARAAEAAQMAAAEDAPILTDLVDIVRLGETMRAGRRQNVAQHMHEALTHLNAAVCDLHGEDGKEAVQIAHRTAWAARDAVLGLMGGVP